MAKKPERSKRDQLPRRQEIRDLLKKHSLTRERWWSVLKKVSLPPVPKDG